MVGEWMGIAVVAVLGSMLCLGTLSLAGRSSRRLAVGALAGVLDEAEPGVLAQGLARLIPVRPAAVGKLQLELAAAGYRGPAASTRYAAARGAMTVVPLFLAALVALLVGTELIPVVLGAGCVAGAVGFSLPRITIQGQARSRARQIEKGLPVAVDLMALCLMAGQDLQSAVGRVGRDLAPSHRALAEELSLTHRLAEIHSLPYAFRAMAERSPVDEIRNLMLLLIQSGRLGTSVAAALTDFADGYRINLRQRAEAQANRTSFWMLFPTTFCLLVSAAIILIAPAYLEFSRQRLDNLREISGINQAAPAPTPPRAVIP